MTEAAEYNVFVDPDAADIVLHSELKALWVSWDCAGGAAAFTDEDLARLARSESGAARFAERCIRQAAGYSGGAVRQAVDICLQTEYKVKSGQMNQEGSLESAMLQIFALQRH